MRRHDLRHDGLEAAERQEPPAPAPAPRSLEWASAVGNQAVARLAAEHQEEPAEEELAEEAPAEEEPAPEEAALAEVDEEQLPE
jgi:hypothetical protein